jgi:anti-sigma regulatory factor (Ser/Thr protein kinase)
MAHPPVHTVDFYEQEGELVGTLARFVAEGLDLGERIVLVATGPHRVRLGHALTHLGIDQLRSSGRLVMVDAQATLDTFWSDGVLDRRAFRRALATLGVPGEGPCRVFGEMVALLWESGDVAGAIELEEAWNEALDGTQVSLLCAYPSSALQDERLGEIGEVCTLHDSVRPPASYTAGPAELDSSRAGQSQVFLPLPEAVAAARHFVARALRDWRGHGLLTDASMIASELATNAVLHASTPFLLSIHQSRDAILIRIEDGEMEHAERQESQEHELSGRGMAIVQALSTRWGSDPVPAGKVVWAELATKDTHS